MKSNKITLKFLLATIIVMMSASMTWGMTCQNLFETKITQPIEKLKTQIELNEIKNRMVPSHEKVKIRDVEQTLSQFYKQIEFSFNRYYQHIPDIRNLIGSELSSLKNILENKDKFISNEEINLWGLKVNFFASPEIVIQGFSTIHKFFELNLIPTDLKYAFEASIFEIIFAQSPILKLNRNLNFKASEDSIQKVISLLSHIKSENFNSRKAELINKIELNKNFISEFDIVMIKALVDFFSLSSVDLIIAKKVFLTALNNQPFNESIKPYEFYLKKLTLIETAQRSKSPLKLIISSQQPDAQLSLYAISRGYFISNSLTDYGHLHGAKDKNGHFIEFDTMTYLRHDFGHYQLINADHQQQAKLAYEYIFKNFINKQKSIVDKEIAILLFFYAIFERGVEFNLKSIQEFFKYPSNFSNFYKDLQPNYIFSDKFKGQKPTFKEYQSAKNKFINWLKLIN